MAGMETVQCFALGCEATSLNSIVKLIPKATMKIFAALPLSVLFLDSAIAQVINCTKLETSEDYVNCPTRDTQPSDDCNFIGENDQAEVERKFFFCVGTFDCFRCRNFRAD
ncbi:hypothetical protein HYALB_00003315 [Hymenoscyphus albidus]|uniref:Uncharacterized protein n=1 Tax=Hymenoscyphus albidus TaxID=595503 RepID=A0A9N9LG51_9HELO|nr:hypothetical protein HYALB_00003315 [Hymenoscyphus albidus]